MSKSILTFVFLLIAGMTFAQDDEGTDNLVPNGDFEDTATKTLKSYGMLQPLTEAWFNATQAKCDVFSSGIKSPKVSVPNNDFGIQDAASGDIYAGFRGYTKDKKKSRSYLEVKFTERLKKDQMYCVQFKVSSGDLSKYAVNNIGAVVSTRKVYQPNTGSLIKDIDVKDRSNKIINTTDGWETICGTVVGTGQEEYLIIGCFAGDSDLKIEKMKRPRNVTGAQTYEAYYYIDDVSVVAVDAKSQCSCASGVQSKPDLIYGAASVVSPDMSAADVLAASAVYYPSLKKSVNAAGVSTLNKVVEMMNDNPDWKLEVIGHSDNDEAAEAKINSRYVDFGKKRAEQVKRYLVSKGIAESRLIVLTKENTAPATTRETEVALAQNRRVTFAIRK